MFCLDAFHFLLAVGDMIDILSATQFTHYLTGLVDLSYARAQSRNILEIL